MKRSVIHVDMDAFFASVELKKRPGLLGKPVIVGGSGDPTKRGVVSAASYEARKFGVKSGMALRVASRLCPEATFLPVDFAAYELESGRFMEILRDYTDLVESFGLDEAFVELKQDANEDPFQKTLNAAREIKKRVKDELGLSLSVGIGPNKLIAKLASDIKKPDGFTVIREKDIAKVLSKMPVRKLWGVGAKTEVRLKKLDIRTIGELSARMRPELEARFGKVFGQALYEHSRGIDSSPVVAFLEPCSRSREVTFECDTGDRHLVKETLRELTKDVVSGLRATGYRSGNVTIKIRYEDFQTITRSVTTSEATDSMDDFWFAVTGLLDKVEFTKKIRLVGVKAGNLEGAAHGE